MTVGEMNLRHYNRPHRQWEQKFHVQPTHSIAGFWWEQWCQMENWLEGSQLQHYPAGAQAVDYSSVITFPHMSLLEKCTARAELPVVLWLPAQASRVTGRRREKGLLEREQAVTSAEVPVFPPVLQREGYSPTKTLLRWEFCLRESFGFGCTFFSCSFLWRGEMTGATDQLINLWFSLNVISSFMHLLLELFVHSLS